MAPLSPASAFLLVVAALFSPLPQDTILLLIGASVAVNPAGAIPLTLAAWAGLLVKNGLIYAAGWALGGRLWSHRWVVARVSPARRAWVERGDVVSARRGHGEPACTARHHCTPVNGGGGPGGRGRVTWNATVVL